MKSAEDIQKAITAYKNHMMKVETLPVSDFHLGFIHGLETALSFVEDRPVLHVDENLEHSEYDLKAYPEYFL